MKKVLVFGMTDIKGGMESCIMNYYRAIDKNIIQFDFLCNFYPMIYNEEVQKNGSKIYYIPKRSESTLKYYQAVSKFFKEHAHEYDAIWFNTCSLANIGYLKYAKRYGIKKRIVHAHNSQNMDSQLRGILHNINKKSIHKYATDFYSCGSGATEFFYGGNSHIKNVVLINNAIDLEKFYFKEDIRNKHRQELKIKESTLVVGHVGRFHFQKNHLFLLDIFKEIYNQHQDSILVLVGVGDDRKKVEEKVEEYKINDSVLFLGQRDDIECLMQAMDIFLFPSVFEGLGMVLIEAQAAGLPCFTSEQVVPKSAKVTDLVEYISLDEGALQWATKVLNLYHKQDRKKYTQVMEKSHYNIKVEAAHFIKEIGD